MGMETRRKISGPLKVSLLGKNIPSSDKYLSYKFFQAFGEHWRYTSSSSQNKDGTVSTRHFFYFPYYILQKSLMKYNQLSQPPTRAATNTERQILLLNSNEEHGSTETLGRNKE